MLEILAAVGVLVVLLGGTAAGVGVVLYPRLGASEQSSRFRRFLNR
jgi:hypothetical protein